MSHQYPGSTRSKRRHIDLDETAQTENKSPVLDSWARFVVTEAADKQPLKLNPFAISKAVSGICGEVKKVTRLRSGSLLVEGSRRQQSLNLLSLTTFANIEVAVSVHKTLNSCRGIVRDRAGCLSDMSEQDITDELKTQGVTAVERFTMKSRDGDIILSNTYLLTFALSAIPTSIKAGYLNIGVEVYVPNPLRCFKCQKFGHGSKSCDHSVICQRCGADHDSINCTSEIKCPNCKGQHLASSRLCPVWQKQSKILKLKHEQNISFYEAKKVSESQSSSIPLTRSYSAAATISAPPTPPTVSISIQTELTWVTSDKPISLSSVITSNTSSTQTVSQSEPLIANSDAVAPANTESEATQADLQSLLEQLPQPCVIMGDLNGLNPLWRSVDTNAKEVFLNNPFDALDMDVTPSPETRRGSSSSHSRERSPIEPP
ncbi:uncharacterized protein LOC125372732 [Haliotis rufescens]|uniref:uncharacterized protein LOC125372732 n=1 Tax=Haliotis rufescens TaxID=6454 RepID=UPI00201E9CFE|nr:uncharacterized protein LOC125372732 [Haliotis rufescens]